MTILSKNRGEYVCFLDSDNAWLPDKPEESLAAFTVNPDAEGTEISRRNMRRHSSEITAGLLRDNFVSMNTTMSRAERVRAAGGFDPKDRLAEDYGLWLRVSTRATFVHVPEFWAYYRIMDEQIPSDKLARLDANEQVCRDFLAEHGHGWLSGEDIRRGWRGFHVRKARHLSSSARSVAALRALTRAMRFQPVPKVPWRALVRVAPRPVSG